MVLLTDVCLNKVRGDSEGVIAARAVKLTMLHAPDQPPGYAALASLVSKLAGPDWLNEKHTYELAERELRHLSAYYFRFCRVRIVEGRR
jgi:hypothetical protein